MTRFHAVGLTATVEIIRNAPRVRLNEAYTDAIRMAGLVPFVIPPVTDEDMLAAALDRIDGLVLTGGEDVAPRNFGATSHPAAGEPNEARDQCELALARLARSRGLPALAICRGVQVVNVAFGGTLIQDIPSEHPGSIPHDPGGDRSRRVHSVTLEKGSRLAEAVGSEEIRTNSFHHQSILRLGGGLRVTGRSSDGIVEGVESVDPSWWLLGAQWHPEELTATPEDWDRRFFSAFADAVNSHVATGLRPAPDASAVPASTHSGKRVNR